MIENKNKSGKEGKIKKREMLQTWSVEAPCPPFPSFPSSIDNFLFDTYMQIKNNTFEFDEKIIGDYESFLNHVLDVVLYQKKNIIQYNTMSVLIELGDLKNN